MTKCQNCKNTIGFVFGTCIVCNWNYLDCSFHLTNDTNKENEK